MTSSRYSMIMVVFTGEQCRSAGNGQGGHEEKKRGGQQQYTADELRKRGKMFKEWRDDNTEYEGAEWQISHEGHRA